MREYAAIWFRAYLIVTITACNVVNIGRGHYGLAFLSGGGLSTVWWFNSRVASRSLVRGAGLAYGLGAACGTITGMWIGRAWL